MKTCIHGVSRTEECSACIAIIEDVANAWDEDPICDCEQPGYACQCDEDEEDEYTCGALPPEGAIDRTMLTLWQSHIIQHLQNISKSIQQNTQSIMLILNIAKSRGYEAHKVLTDSSLDEDLMRISVEIKEQAFKLLAATYDNSLNTHQASTEEPTSAE